jgi:phage tail protein X
LEQGGNPSQNASMMGYSADAPVFPGGQQISIPDKICIPTFPGGQQISVPDKICIPTFPGGHTMRCSSQGCFTVSFTGTTRYQPTIREINFDYLQSKTTGWVSIINFKL